MLGYTIVSNKDVRNEEMVVIVKEQLPVKAANQVFCRFVFVFSG
ncbi:MAG: hypothetical protein JWO44_1296 [Bacteroidetes bacterium]|jgi:hypothetical protein|nr:hypothetical protein [Bacteroidota bacterium]